MKWKFEYLFLFAIAIVILSSCSGNNSPSSTKSKNKDRSGKELFDNYCSGCHGSDGTAGIMQAANLKLSRLSGAAISQVTTEGKNAMPSFKTKFTDEEIMRIANYVINLQK